MAETAQMPSAPFPTAPTTPRAGAPRTGSRHAPRPARPRATTTVSAAILTDRGLAEGYVALPLARLMAQRVWPSVETLNQHLVLLEQNSFTRMTSDPTFEPHGKALQQLLRASAALTEAVATLTQRLAQNRLTEADRLALTTGDLALLLSATPPAPVTSPPDPPEATPPAAAPEATHEADHAGTSAEATEATTGSPAVAWPVDLAVSPLALPSAPLEVT